MLGGSSRPHDLECEDCDFDTDGDVDGGDFGYFQRSISSEDMTTHPNCAD